jgi:hypothetical protein
MGKSSGLGLARTLTEFRKAAGAGGVDIPCDDNMQGSFVERLAEAHARQERDKYQLPDHAFSLRLIDLYFERFHPCYPFLHEPMVRRDFAAEEWRTNISFRALLFAIFAISSRFVDDDPRVLHDWGFAGFLDERPTRHACGYAFSLAATKLLSSPTSAASLCDLQAATLCVVYLMGTASPLTAWSMLGYVIRRAYDVGAHRRANRVWTSSAVIDEVRKRVWWALYCLDRSLSAGLGRPLLVQDEDVDVDYPFEITDAELDALDQRQLPFPRQYQPPSVASGSNPSPALLAMTAFISNIQLHQILGRALKTIYALNKDQLIHADRLPMWEQRTVAELDSSLNAWLDKLPPHLRWCPEENDPNYIVQSGLVLSTYYGLQVSLVHLACPPSWLPCCG